MRGMLPVRRGFRTPDAGRAEFGWWIAPDDQPRSSHQQPDEGALCPETRLDPDAIVG